MAFTGKIYFRILGLGLRTVDLALHVSGLGLDTSDLVNIPDGRPFYVALDAWQSPA